MNCGQENGPGDGLTQEPHLPPHVRRALTSAAEMRLVSALLEADRNRPETLRGLARETPDGALHVLVDRFEAAGEAARLPLVRPGSPVSPREVAYRSPMEDPGRIMSDLAHVYRAFGYTPGGRDPVDHLAVEVGFLGYLWLKEAYAAACSDTDAEDLTRRARVAFIREHLGFLVCGLRARLEKAAFPELQALVIVLAERLGNPDITISEWTPPRDDDDGIACPVQRDSGARL